MVKKEIFINIREKLISFFKTINMKIHLPFLCIMLTVIPFISKAQKDTDSTTVIFEKVDIEASFPGGDNAWAKFLQTNLHAEVPADKNAPAGYYTVLIQFLVDKEGKLSDITPLTNWGYGMEEEVIRVLKKSPDWTPAEQNKRKVKAYRKQPVTFMVIDDDFEITSQKPYTFYTGTLNRISVTAYKVKSEDISISIPGAIVTALGDGNFTVKVNHTGRVTITITNTKKNKEIGQASFEVIEKK